MYPGAPGVYTTVGVKVGAVGAATVGVVGAEPTTMLPTDVAATPDELYVVDPEIAPTAPKLPLGSMEATAV